MIKLADYDYVVINTSSGKDSQTLMRYVHRQALDEGYPMDRIVAAHADLGAMEWPGTVELAEEQSKIYHLRFWKMARPQGDLLTHIKHRGMWPSSTARFCTSDHKRGQIMKLFTELVEGAGWSKGDKPVRILNTMGMRAEESPARSKLKPFTHNPTASNGKRQRVSPREEISLSANFMEQAQHLGWCGATETSLPSKLRTKREALIGK